MRRQATRKSWLGVWRDLDPQTRREIALTAFENDKLNKAAMVALARHDRVRRQTVEKWSLDTRADHFARMRRLPSSQLAAALFTHFHLVKRRNLVVGFLDFLKIPHDGTGLILNIESVERPAKSRMVAAIRRLVASHPRAHVSLFLDVLSCQTTFDVFAEFDEARIEALGDDQQRAKKPAARPPTDTFGGLDTDLEAEPEPTRAERTPPPSDETPASFTTLDQILIRSVIASVADVHGALGPEKVEDLVEEVIQLNLERHHSYFHRGFLTVLLGRPLELDFPEASDVRRGWYACGAIVGYKRRGNVEAVIDLLTQRADIARELARPGTGYAERIASIVFEAYCAKGRFAEAARFLSPDVVGRAGVPFAREVLEIASGLIRDRREADARRILDVLREALPVLSEDPDLPASFGVLLQRRRAHCARLRGDFEAARKLLEPQLDAADPGVRSDILADLGLIECGLRSLADVKLPPEESMLRDFAAEFEPGWRNFERSSKVGGGGRNHGDFCIGMALFAKGDGHDAIPYLERAVAGMSADPDRYGRFGPLDSARLALAVALAELTDLARVHYARDLLRQVLDSRTKIPDYMMRRALAALELTDPDAAIEVAHELYKAVGARALDVLAETRIIRHVPAALDELLAQAKRNEHSAKHRWSAAKTVLAESHAMRDASSADEAAVVRERATEALDVLVEIAEEEEVLRQELIDMLDHRDGVWRTAIDPLDARVVQAALYEAGGEFANAASKLAQAFHATLDADDEWALGKADALLEDIRALAGEQLAAALEPRLAQYREVFERRSQSGLVIPPSVDPEDLYGLVLIVGGNETQAQQDDALIAQLKKQWPNITLLFERTGWNSNWGEQLRAMEGELARARVVVIMRYVRTMLGKSLRKRCNELDIPWVACTGSGRASMHRAIEQAILLAWRQSNLAQAGQ